MAAAAPAPSPAAKPKLLYCRRPAFFNLFRILSFLAIAFSAGGVAATPSEIVMVNAATPPYRRELQADPSVFCVAKPNAATSSLQNALDWTCGSGSSLGSVDCSAIQQGGSCFQPDTVASHASYAFTLYYYKQNGASGSCDFNGLATLTQTNPSSGTCVYPSSAASSPSLNSTLPSPFSTTFPFLGSPAPSPSGTCTAVPSLHGVPTFLCILALAILLEMRSI